MVWRKFGWVTVAWCALTLGLAQAQLPIPGQSPAAPAASAPLTLEEEREQAERALKVTLERLSDQSQPSPFADATEKAAQLDRQRLLDRLVFLQGERIKRLNELGELQKAKPPGASDLQVVRALGDTPPYKALAVEAVREELAALQQRAKAAQDGLMLRETEKQVQLDQLKRLEAQIRLMTDRLAVAKGEAEQAQMRAELEQANLNKQVLDTELTLLAIDIDKLKIQQQLLSAQAQSVEAVVMDILPQQRFTQDDVRGVQRRMAQLSAQVAQEIDRAKQRQARHSDLLALRTSANRKVPTGTPTLEWLEQALTADGAILDGLHGLEALASATNVAWERRLVLATSDDPQKREEAREALVKLYERLVSRKRLSQEHRAIALAAIREQEARVFNLTSSRGGDQSEQQLLSLLQERGNVAERIEQVAERLERQLSRWLADDSSLAVSTITGRAKVLGRGLHQGWLAFWNYEIFAIEDVSEVDGRKVSVSYGITVGKSIGALLLYVLGYWLFSRLVRLFERVLVRRFGVSEQLASVVRRWMMILLAVVLVLLILNLARIPLTVFAFMGGALAIGIGFGTQTIIKNFISGVIILFERKIRVGDIIELGGMTGHVMAVDLRATTVRGFNGVEALVPNSVFLENQVTNWTYSNQHIRKELRVGVAYGSPSKYAESLLTDVAKAHPQVLPYPEPEVFFEDLGDNALQMVLVYWVDLSAQVSGRRVDSDLRHATYAKLEEAGMAIPFPQRDVHLDMSKPMQVVLSRAPKVTDGTVAG